MLFRSTPNYMNKFNGSSPPRPPILVLRNECYTKGQILHSHDQKLIFRNQFSFISYKHFAAGKCPHERCLHVAQHSPVRVGRSVGQRSRGLNSGLRSARQRDIHPRGSAAFRRERRESDRTVALLPDAPAARPGSAPVSGGLSGDARSSCLL